MTLQQQKINSFKKAFMSAVIAPIVLFITMQLIDSQYSLTVVALWISFTSFVYKTSSDKQITAGYFFNMLKIEAMLLMPVAILIATALYLGHFN